MHEVMSGYMDRRELRGLVTLVARRGEVHVDAKGRKAVGGIDSIRRDTTFRISSMTKAITSGAGKMLVEECKLHLDVPADRLLPELGDRKILTRIDASLDDTVPAHR